MGEWIQRAERYRARMEIDVRTGVAVSGVWPEGEGLVIATDGGELRARHVIDATGQISWPRRPEGRGMHSLNVREADLAHARALMIVGGGTSAAETLETWLRVRLPGARAWVVRRSGRLITPKRPFGIDIHYWVWPFEKIPLRKGKRPPHPLTFGGVLLTSRLRPSVHMIASAEEMPVTPDLVVYATGYRHAAPHLGDLVERYSDGEPRVASARSTRTPNLWVLGVSGARTSASAFLRGIAADAEHVAKKIAGEIT
jgi:putative flavoprotein involved in K+ transport